MSPPSNLFLLASIFLITLLNILPVHSVPSSTTHLHRTSTRSHTILASLEDGPTEHAAKMKRAQYQLRRDARPQYTHEERIQHLIAAQTARAYAAMYIPHIGGEDGTMQHQRHPPPKAYRESGYDMLARQQLQKNKNTKKQQSPQSSRPSSSSPSSDSFHFAESGTAFVEEGIKLKTQTKAKAKTRAKTNTKAKDPYEKQEWTYADAGSPPEWLVPDGEAKQGCPTTKPPAVPRMPPPPPPTPTPTWMSPFDEHNTPVFPQSSTPAPFYGMGPPPQQAPGNYLPLDTFMSPAPEGGGGE